MNRLAIRIPGFPDDELARMSSWLPFVAKTLEPAKYPRTLPVPCEIELAKLADGQMPSGYFQFLGELDKAARLIGYPVFIRTDKMSAKHSGLMGSNGPACYVQTPLDLIDRVYRQWEDAEMNSFILPNVTDWWFIRQLLEPVPWTMTAFGGLKIGPERRVLVNLDESYDLPRTAEFPYWPVDAIETSAKLDGHPIGTDRIAELVRVLDRTDANNETVDQRVRDSIAVVEAMGGHRCWSVDWMRTWLGWVLIDMAPAEVSWWPSYEFLLPGQPTEAEIEAKESNRRWTSVLEPLGG